MRLTHVEGAVLCGSDPAAAARIDAALGAILARVYRVELRADASDLERLCDALTDCKAHALLVASDALGDLAPRAALALVAAMPARGGPELVAFERSGGADLRLALLRADCAGRIAAASDLAALVSALDTLLVPADWLD